MEGPILMYGENREYPQMAHLLVPLGVMVIGAVLAVTHHPLWWLLVAAFAGRAAYLVWLINKRRRRDPGSGGPSTGRGAPGSGNVSSGATG